MWLEGEQCSHSSHATTGSPGQHSPQTSCGWQLSFIGGGKGGKCLRHAETQRERERRVRLLPVIGRKLIALPAGELVEPFCNGRKLLKPFSRLLIG